MGWKIKKMNAQIEERIEMLEKSNRFYTAQIEKYTGQHEEVIIKMTQQTEVEDIKHSIKMLGILEEMLSQYKVWIEANDELIELEKALLK